MKYSLFILLILLISHISSAPCLSKTDASSSKDCKDLDPGTGFKYCCYLKGKSGGISVNMCIPLTKEAYDDIDKTIKDTKDSKGEVDKLDCKSYYIQFCLLSLLFVLL